MTAAPARLAYCVRCRRPRVMTAPRPARFPNGAEAIQGTCPACTGRLMRFTKPGTKSGMFKK